MFYIPLISFVKAKENVSKCVALSSISYGASNFYEMNLINFLSIFLVQFFHLSEEYVQEKHSQICRNFFNPLM